MKKNYTPLNKKQIVIRNTSRVGILFVAGFLLYVFIYYNIVSSQAVSPLYYKFISGDKAATVDIVRTLRFHKEYDTVFLMQKNIFGESLDYEVNKELNERKRKIVILESHLQKNPKAEELLYRLAMLYKENGDLSKSKEYLERAQKINPSLK